MPTPALFCHNEPARSSKDPTCLCLLLAGSLWQDDRFHAWKESISTAEYRQCRTLGPGLAGDCPSCSPAVGCWPPIWDIWFSPCRILVTSCPTSTTSCPPLGSPLVDSSLFSSRCSSPTPAMCRRRRERALITSSEDSSLPRAPSTLVP